MWQRLLFGLSILVLGAGCLADTQSTARVAPLEPLPPVEEIADTARSTAETEVVEDAVPVEVPLEPLAVELRSSNFAFTPDIITAKTGQEVLVTFSHSDGAHTFVIDDIGVNETIVSGETVAFTAPLVSGTYTYYCSVGSHRDLGMSGKLIVE